MKILVINNGYPSSKEPNIYIFVHKQVKALLEAGYEVIVMDIDLRSIRWRRRYGCFFEQFQGVNIYRFSFPFITVKLTNLYSFLNEIIGLSLYKKIVKKYGDFDIIHSHFGKGSGNAGSAIKRKFGIPFIITEHSSRVLLGKRRTVKCSLNAYKNAGKIIVVSNALKEKLDMYNVKNIAVIPNVIDTNLFRIDKKINKYLDFTFLSAGQLNKGKRFDLLILAFQEILLKGYKCKLKIIGIGSQKRVLDKLIKDNHIGNITFLGEVPNNDMAEQYNKSHCFVLPSDFETFGVVYAEAVACGIPVIATDNGGSKEIVNYKNGLIVKLGDKKELVDAMEYMIQRADQYNPKALHDEVQQRFGKENFINQLKAVYENALNDSDRD